MSKGTNLEENHDFFFTKRFKEVIILTLKENLLLHATNLTDRDTIQDYFDRVSKCRSVKAMVINSSLEKSGPKEYLEFYQSMKSKWERNEIRRLCNIMNQFILTITELNKIVIHACSGSVIALFLNVSLACDYRIIADNTVFCNPYLELGMLPKGGGPFFLSRMLGPGKAYEILLLNREITAQQAMTFGIADQMVPLEKLEDSALEVAHRFGEHYASSLSGIKKLVNYSLKELKDYLEFENKEIFRIVDSPDFDRSRGYKC
ncbi:enoyl-CoA hydratase/isomerase family protein [Desulfonema magnum]|uniref:Enoyl-CoA hydratase/isomerase n=1 Tax=Desulfonema magnum TaxID=45655 RepID=A0A975BSS0_9BACT|nr:enoyl-CoA hydratase/isomerase family protein [Desulfonema magnum]QTA90966.1 Enoyl-CoA hydratase/isomerase [Desulfonema magnum]